MLKKISKDLARREKILEAMNALRWRRSSADIGGLERWIDLVAEALDYAKVIPQSEVVTPETAASSADAMRRALNNFRAAALQLGLDARTTPLPLDARSREWDAALLDGDLRRWVQPAHRLLVHLRKHPDIEDGLLKFAAAARRTPRADFLDSRLIALARKLAGVYSEITGRQPGISKGEGPFTSFVRTIFSLDGHPRPEEHALHAARSHRQSGA